MNKRFFGLALLFSLALGACSKKEKCDAVNITAPADEVNNLKAYLDGAGITATQDPRGFFYTIITPGAGENPTPCSGVDVNYAGKLTTGVPFDSGNNVRFYLSQLIVGWQEGIPLIAPGGSIVLYLPPSLAYGAVGSPPRNTRKCQPYLYHYLECRVLIAVSETASQAFKLVRGGKRNPQPALFGHPLGI